MSGFEPRGSLVPKAEDIKVRFPEETIIWKHSPQTVIYVDLEEGKEYKVVVEEDIDELIKKYRGVLGKSSVEEFWELEEEAQVQ